MALKISKTRLDFGTVGMKNYAETVNALGNATGVTNIDYSLGSVVTATTTGATTWNVINPAASGKASSFTLILSKGGSNIQTWMSGTKWSNGIPPILSVVGTDVLDFFSTDGGSTWLGVLAMTTSNNSQMTNTFYAAGLGANGQLGLNNLNNTSLPTQVGPSSIWSKASTGFCHTIAYKTDGTLWAWGAQSLSQVGDNSTVARSSPVRIGSLFTWTSSISAGAAHSLALQTNGTIWSWGNGTLGQLGDNTSVNKSSPVQVGTVTGWTRISAGKYHSLACKSDGTLWAWGQATSGKLGDNQTATNRSSPVQIGALTAWANQPIATGASHSLARKTDGTLWGWGEASIAGQIGDNTGTDKSSPVQIGGLTDWSGISAGVSHTLAYKTDGTLWAWGRAANGQLGDNQTALSRSSPVQIGNLTTWAGVSAGACHSLAYKTDGTVWSWGVGDSGQLADGIALIVNSPVQIGAGASWTTSVTGSYTSFATRSDGTLWAWGMATFGQLGDNTTVSKSSPVQVGALTTWSNAKISSGSVHAVIVRSDNTMWSFGKNSGTSSGILGDNTILDKSSPVQIGTLTNWAKISAGSGHSLAIQTDGTLWAWGGAGSGQLGDNQIAANRSSPVKVGTLTNWSSVSAGNSQSLAIKTDGSLWVWGLGTSGQLGDSTAVTKSSPVKVGTLTIWSSISAGNTHSVGYRSDGTIWAWGGAGSGQLGNNTTTIVSSPIQVGTLTTWASIVAGSSHNLATKMDGTLWAWGIASSGQLGDNQIASNRSSPVQIGALTNWLNATIFAGNSHTVAFKTDGTIWSWGDRTTGKIGDNIMPGKSSPVQVGTLGSWTAISDGSASSSTFLIR